MELGDLVNTYYRIAAACPQSERDALYDLVIGAFELGRSLRVDKAKRAVLSDEDRMRVWLAYQAALVGRRSVAKGVVRALMAEFGLGSSTVITIGRGPAPTRDKPPSLRIVRESAGSQNTR